MEEIEEMYARVGSHLKTRVMIYDMSKKTKLNDQAPKPILGNSPVAHGRVNTDDAGGSGPSKNRPVKPQKGK